MNRLFLLSHQMCIRDRNYTVTESTVPATYNGVSEFVVTLKADCTGLEFVGTAPSGVTLHGLTIKVENIRKAQHNVIVHYVEQGTTNELATQATAVTKYCLLYTSRCV